MTNRIYTIWGKTSDGFLISNVGKIRPRNIYSFQNNLEGFFKYRTDRNIIVEYISLRNPEKTKQLVQSR